MKDKDICLSKKVESQRRRNKTYYNKHRDEILEYKHKDYKRWYHDNRENIIKSSKKNYQEVRGSLTKRFSVIKSQAKIRGKEFNLTKEYVEPLFKAPCYYCGDKTESLNLDRVDNSKGYVIGNVVSCCNMCNRIKSTMTLDEMLIHINKIINNVNR